MKNLSETIDLTESRYITESDLNDKENEEYQAFLNDLNKAFEEGGAEGCNEFLQKCKDDGMYEGFLGGMAGFLVGPSMGKIVARALGLEHGLLYDLLTSRLVSAALGSAIQKEISSR